MLKVAAAAAVVLGVTGGAISVFGTALGVGAEAAALGLSGAGLWAASYGLGGKLGARPAGNAETA